MSRRSAAVLAAVLLVAVVAVAALTLPRQGPVAASPSPSPSPTAQPTPSATPSASPATTPTATPSPSPAASAGSIRFVNALAGYSIDLSPPWRRSACWSTASGTGAEISTFDAFVPVPAYDEESGHTGLAHDHVEVSAQPDQDLTPREWYSSGRAGRSADDRLTETTLAGESALRIVSSEWDRYLVSHGNLMFDVASFARGGESTPEQRAALVRTFRFLTEAERNAARAQPSPTPGPARSAEQVADALADGFTRKDVGILATVIRSSCISYGFAEAGASTKSSQRYLDELNARFAAGLSVEVERNTLEPAEGIDDRTRVVESTWREPGQPDHRIHLTISPEGERWSWSGTIDFGPVR